MLGAHTPAVPAPAGSGDGRGHREPGGRGGSAALARAMAACLSDVRAMCELCVSDVRAMSERCLRDVRAMSERCPSDAAGGPEHGRHRAPPGWGLGERGRAERQERGPWPKEKLLCSAELRSLASGPRPGARLPSGALGELHRVCPGIFRGPPSCTVSLLPFPSKASAARGKGGGTGSAIPTLAHSQTELANVFPRWELGRESRVAPRCRAGVFPDLQVQVKL